jgi:hypothetical protein
MRTTGLNNQRLTKCEVVLPIIGREEEFSLALGLKVIFTCALQLMQCLG